MSPTNSGEEFTHREIKNNYQFENFLTLITKPAHGIRLTRLSLGCRALRIQTGKYENRGALIPVISAINFLINCMRPMVNIILHFNS